MAGGGYSSSASASGGNDEIHQRAQQEITNTITSGAGARGPVFNFGGTLDASAKSVNPFSLDKSNALLIGLGVAALALVAWLLLRRKKS
jgi:LPXTG-motif cell wall-anchored protein